MIGGVARRIEVACISTIHTAVLYNFDGELFLWIVYGKMDVCVT